MPRMSELGSAARETLAFCSTYIMPPQHLFKLILLPHLPLAEILCFLRLFPAREMGWVLRYFCKVIRVESQRLERNRHIKRTGAGIAQTQDFHGHLAAAIVEEIDGPEFRRRGAEDCIDQVVEEYFGVTLLQG